MNDAGRTALTAADFTPWLPLPGDPQDPIAGLRTPELQANLDRRLQFVNPQKWILESMIEGIPQPSLFGPDLSRIEMISPLEPRMMSPHDLRRELEALHQTWFPQLPQAP